MTVKISYGEKLFEAEVGVKDQRLESLAYIRVNVMQTFQSGSVQVEYVQNLG